MTELLSRFRRRVPGRWWLSVPGFAIGAGITASVPLRDAGLPGPDAAAVAAAIASAPVVIVLAASEEIGWRGHLLPRLQRSISPAGASLLISIPWSIWHLPLLLQISGPNADVPVWAYPAGALAGAFVYTCLFNATNGSLALVTAVHAVRNIVSGVFLADLPTTADVATAYKADVALMVLVGMALFAVQSRSGEKHHTDDGSVIET